jgi:hypothetical protein
MFYTSGKMSGQELKLFPGFEYGRQADRILQAVSRHAVEDNSAQPQEASGQGSEEIMDAIGEKTKIDTAYSVGFLATGNTITPPDAPDGIIPAA